MLDRHWVDVGYTAPNERVYPWQWLWDSCFHALVWQELGRPDRALVELEQALSTQDASGFVPHMNYQLGPGAHADLWGREATSSITQPPMYGHVVAALLRAGVAVPEPVIDRAERGLLFLIQRRIRHACGLIELCHPWESGADDSPRWDDLCPDGFERERWRRHKSDLVAHIEHDSSGAPIANPAFPVASIGFNALVVFNARELAAATGRSAAVDAGTELVSAIEGRWNGRGWTDAGPASAGSGRIGTVDAMLALLVVADPRQLEVGWSMVDDDAHFAGPFGPRGVDRIEPGYDPMGYWRGPCWPQLAYLLWYAAVAQDRLGTADRLASSTVAGAVASTLAEYWNADTGVGLGAVPQSWAGLVLLMDRSTAALPAA